MREPKSQLVGWRDGLMVRGITAPVNLPQTECCGCVCADCRQTLSHTFKTPALTKPTNQTRRPECDARISPANSDRAENSARTRHFVGCSGGAVQLFNYFPSARRETHETRELCESTEIRLCVSPSDKKRTIQHQHTRANPTPGLSRDALSSSSSSW